MNEEKEAVSTESETNETTTDTETTENENVEENQQKELEKAEQTEETATNEEETTANEGPAASTDSSDATDIVFIDPSPVTTYDAGMYEIDLVHTVTLGDFLIGTLLCILIAVQLIGRLFGGR